MELQKDTDNKYKIIEESDKVTIKNEADVQMFANESTEIVLNRNFSQSVQKEQMVSESCLDRKEFEDTTQIFHELTFKTENGEVFEIKKEKVAVNDYDREEFGVSQITRVFIEDEYDRLIDMEDADNVFDRACNAHDTKTNFYDAFVASEGVFKVEDEEI
ncbi:unnamed protein product [Acanthoscelides obtectus]|uniref:Uncharacterized protein n=1 Tax=Acanthoscelides obtectus TaxID=200917 RepID=A0A9P0KKX5_ACAOB|nr:unnamed protein product [Acanthoscelides obtectus]CAK1664820.1 hypothetical protein AOBTE_LOCUS24485 [Acanthoscelides obtectus]